MKTVGKDALLLLLMFSALCPVRTSDESLSDNFDIMSSSESSDPSSNTLQRGSRIRTEYDSNTVSYDKVVNSLLNKSKYDRNVVRSPPQIDPSSVDPSVNAISRGSAANRRNKPKREPCLACAANQHNQMLEETLPEQELRQLRIDMIKNQILKKLRLDRPPVITDQEVFPPPVIFGDTLNSHKESKGDDDEGDFEDFYGKPEQLIVFSESAVPNCDHFTKHSHSEPSSCFVFKSPKEIELEQVSKVELWFRNSINNTDFKSANHTFWAYELFLKESNGIHKRPKELGTEAYERQRAGWLSLDITNSSSKWLRSRMRGMGIPALVNEHVVQIGCRNCGATKDQSPVGTSGEDRPFMVFSIAEAKKKRRKRRNEINCSKGTTDCCRERFVINFKAINWNWVVYPESYDAYICKGSCTSINNISLASDHRTTAQMDWTGAARNRTHLVPCCAATRTSSIDIGYRRENDSVVETQRLPNMVIESCGCRM